MRDKVGKDVACCRAHTCCAQVLASKVPSPWRRCLAQCSLSALGPRPAIRQAGRGRGLCTRQPRAPVPRLRSPCLGRSWARAVGGGRTRTDRTLSPVHHSPSTHRAVQKQLLVPCPRSHRRCIRSAYCSGAWSVRPAPPRPSPRAGQWRHVTLCGQPSPRHRREGPLQAVSERPRGRFGASALRGVPGLHRGRLETRGRSSPDSVGRVRYANQGQGTWGKGQPWVSNKGRSAGPAITSVPVTKEEVISRT